MAIIFETNKATTTVLIGDVRQRLTEIPDDSVDLVMTSPPFLSLRDYLKNEHNDKHLEIGRELNPGTFVDALCEIVDQLGRVLAPHGSMVWELGDTYAGSGGAGGDYGKGGLREGQPRYKISHNAKGWSRHKSLAMIPELFRLTLAYGTNPLTGHVWWEGDDKWIVRNVVTWVKTNPMVGSLADKFRPATTDLAVFTRSPKRWFDTEPVRSSTHAPPLDWWQINTARYPGSHHATYPPELCEIPILSMCPKRVCNNCNHAPKRILESRLNPRVSSPRVTIGWDTCECTDHCEPVDACDEHYRLGVVLDPFCGSGTTLAVATEHGRTAIGIDLDERNAALMKQRIGSNLTIRPL